MINGQMLLENLIWIDKIVKISEMLKNYMLVGLGKNFARSVKNFGGPGQFGKVWEKIRNVGGKISFGYVREKDPGGQFWQRGGGRDFMKFHLTPQRICVAPQMPPSPNSETWRRHWTLLCAIKAVAITWLREFFLTITAQRGGTSFGATWYKLCKMN